VYFTSILRDENGKKFSKSLGNSPDPFDLFEKYGTDAVRFGTMLMAPQGLDVLFSSKRLEVGRNFINKLWNASRFVLMNVDDEIPVLDLSKKDLNLPELWILSRLQRTIERVDKNLNRFQFNEAAKAIYKFTWSDYCDWYIEIAKTHFSNGDKSSADVIRAVTVHVLRNIILLLHPYAPFVTEEIWSQIKKENDVDAIISAWPIVDERWVDETVEPQMELLKGVISSVRTIRAQMNVPPNKYADMIVHCNSRQKSILNSYSTIICSLARIDKITPSEGGNKPLNSATSIVDGMEIFIPLEGLIDFDLERNRLQKRIDEIESHLEVLSQKLNNKDFLNRAPKNVVKREKEKRAEMSEELDKMSSNLEMIQ
jgi:valyl-tRNA synthetase